jgi:hypothetical protein
MGCDNCGKSSIMTNVELCTTCYGKELKQAENNGKEEGCCVGAKRELEIILKKITEIETVFGTKTETSIEIEQTVKQRLKELVGGKKE